MPWPRVSASVAKEILRTERAPGRGAVFGRSAGGKVVVLVIKMVCEPGNPESPENGVNNRIYDYSFIFSRKE
ncbi:hypothetical protein [Paracidovorax avenae]|uniref:hypothetical protein n=1 Tax=Paracidovorax avenae TaxID=80867 RepID=UPI00142ECA0C|nr:hypothetical protein [Paracidovorax avenae]